MRRPSPPAFLGADLHIHTCFSDGQDDPSEIVARARGCLSLISICDHDTIAAYDALEPVPELAILPGIEITARVGESSIHLLGYFPAGFTPSFRTAVHALEEDRRARIHRGVTRLRNLGIPLRWAQLGAAVGPGVPCRSHVARTLVELRRAHTPRYPLGRFRLSLDQVPECLRPARGNQASDQPRLPLGTNP